MKKYSCKNITSDEVEVLYELIMNAITDDDHTLDGLCDHIDLPDEDIESALDGLVAKGFLEVKE